MKKRKNRKNVQRRKKGSKSVAEKDHGWIKRIKIKNSPALVCSKNKDHKFIKTHKNQKQCLFCERGIPYPPPLPVNYFVDPDELSPEEILGFL